MEFSYSSEETPPAMIVQVTVYHPGRTYSENSRAKLDTGASISVIPNSIIYQLNLQPMGETRVLGYGDTEPRIEPYFNVVLDLGGGLSFLINAISRDREQVLIGRDVLNQLILHADGPAQTFELTGP